MILADRVPIDHVNLCEGTCMFTLSTHQFHALAWPCTS